LMSQPRLLTASTALRFVLILGVANLFADMTYEGARSTTGIFLESLGASAAVVGFTAGFGELLGYALRSLFGYLGDRTGRYWLMALSGYAINLLAVPALALAGEWPVAAGLIIAERAGRAVRKPQTAAMLSHAGKHMGSGWAFGLNEALDQAGATVGPLILALVLYLNGDYRLGFALLLIPALLSLGSVLVARWSFPNPQDLHAGRGLQTQGLSKSYWLYMLAAGCVAAGFADFALLAYHFQQTGAVATEVIPIYYAVAMVTGAVGALVLGRLFDRAGLIVLIAGFALSSLFAPLVFLGNAWVALAGMILWGLGMGVQESLLKATVAGVISADRRATAFGVFDTGFGVAWFLGSWAIGVLYGFSIEAVIVFSVGLQLAALPIFVLAAKKSNNS
jgi:MFS family permease